MLDKLLQILIPTPPLVAAAGALSERDHAIINLSGDVNWSNWAVVIALGLVSYFLRRLVNKIDNTKLLAVDVDRRLLVVETHMEDCEWNKGGRRSYDPRERQNVE